MLLNFLMFGTLPDLNQVDRCDIEELEPLAALLNLYELQHHLDKKVRRGSFRLRRQQQNLASLHQKKNEKSFHGIATNNKAATINTTTTNNNTDKGAIRAIRLKKPAVTSKPKCNSSSMGSHSSKDATVSFAFRKMHAALENRRLTQQTKKLTHADHCAMSDHVF